MYIKLHFTWKIIIYFNASRRARHQGEEHAEGDSNLLMGKFDRKWRIQQREYEALETRKRKDQNIKRKLDGTMLNPYAHNETNKHQKKKKNKKSKDVL